MVELKGLRSLQGLDALIAESKLEVLPAKESVLLLSINALQPGKFQPRMSMDEQALNELAASIRAEGIILPLIVRRVGVEQYEIIAGERRFRAAKIVGLQVVPAIVRDISDETALAFGLIENIQRESLNPIDEALAFMRLKEDFALTHEEIAERVGRSRSAITNLLRLLGLCTEVKTLLITKKLEVGHARALLSLAPSQQQACAKQIIEKTLSVRETEKMVQKNRQSILLKPVNHLHHEQAIAWETLLTRLLATKVSVRLNQQGNGKVTIEVNSPEEIEWLIKALENQPH